MPATASGRVIGGVEMVIGIAFIAFVTAGVTSTVIQRGGAEAQEADRAERERSTQTIIDAVTQTRQVLAELGDRLDQIQSKITK